MKKKQIRPSRTTRTTGGKKKRTKRYHTSIDPRQSMMVLPHWLQWVLTELTGKAAQGQEPPFQWTPGGRLAFTILLLLIGMSMSLTGVTMRGAMYALLVPGWLLTVASMRTFQTSFVHHASHGMFLKPIKLGTRVAELLSVLIWIQPLSLYKPDHLLHHSQTATLKDADLRFLVALGFRPGLSMGQYWKMFLGMLLSPQFHLTYARYRLRANFVTAPSLRKFAVVAWTLILVAVAMIGGWTWELLLVWMVPAWPLYQMSGLAQLLTEHNWVRIGDGKDRVPVVLGRLTHARFFGEAVPAPGTGYVAWLGWWFRMVLIHLPQRMAVAQLDLTNHDWHHRVSHGDWANSAYARRDDALKPSSQWPEYTERWGFHAAASDTFRLLGSLPQTAILGEPLTYVEWNDGFAGM